MKKVKNIQKISGNDEKPDEENITSKEEKIKDAKDEIIEEKQFNQIDYDELPDGVYDFAGLDELQHRKTKPNLKENEKILKAKNKKDKKKSEKENFKVSNNTKKKNIVEEIFEEKRNNNEENKIVKKETLEVVEKQDRKVIQDKTPEVKNIDEKLKDEPKILDPKEEKPNEKPEKSKNQIKEETKKIDEKPEASKNQVKEEIKKLDEKPEESKRVEKNEKEKNHLKPDFQEENDESYEEEYEETFFEKVYSWFTIEKIFTFLIMMFLGIITQISFLAVSRMQNLTGLVSITVCAISLVLLVNALKIENKIIITVISLISVLLPVYNDLLITGENAFMISSMIMFSLLSINLVFASRKRIICNILAVLLFSIVYNNLEYGPYIFLIVGIIRILKDAFSRDEDTLPFIFHCIMVCVLSGISMFL